MDETEEILRLRAEISRLATANMTRGRELTDLEAENERLGRLYGTREAETLELLRERNHRARELHDPTGIERLTSERDELHARWLGMRDAYDVEVRREGDARREAERLRWRTHEIQAQEMAKRATLDAQIAESRLRWDAAKRWTEDEGLLAEWACGEFASSPFWGMTSQNARDALARLVGERDAARAENELLRGEIDDARAEVREITALYNARDAEIGALRAGGERLRAVADTGRTWQEQSADPAREVAHRRALSALDAVPAAETGSGYDCYCGPNGGPHRHVPEAETGSGGEA